MTAGHCQEYRELLDTLRLVEILAAMTVGKAKLDSKAVDAPLGISFKTLFMVALGLLLLWQNRGSRACGRMYLRLPDSGEPAQYSGAPAYLLRSLWDLPR